MKSFTVLAVLMFVSLLTTYFMGCTPHGIPISSTLAATSTSTRTGTPTHSPTITYTPGGPTNTATCTMTATSATTPFVIYSNGAIYNFGSIVTNTGVFNDGASPSPGLNAAAGGGDGADTSCYEVTFTGLPGNGGSGTYTGMQLSTTSPSLANMTGLSTCTFYAKANQSCVVGFNASESGGDYYNVGESLTSSWQQFSINITNASRTDGWGSPNLTSVSNYFVVLLTSPTYNSGDTSGYSGTFPLNVYFDKVSFH
jgi:hypothetical protein